MSSAVMIEIDDVVKLQKEKLPNFKVITELFINLLKIDINTSV